MGLFGEVKCGRCDRRYSAIRRRCPYCGASKRRGGKRANPGGGMWQIVAGVLLLIAIIVAVIVLITMSLKPKEPGDVDEPPISTATGTAQQTQTGSPAVSDPAPSPEPTGSAAPGDEVDVLSLTIDLKDFTLFYVGEQAQITATVRPEEAADQVEWTSADPNIATVSKDGLVTAAGRGTTTVTAKAGDLTASCIVRVNADASASPSGGQAGAGSSGSLRLSHTDVTVSSAGAESFTLSVSGAQGTVSYSSSNPSVATVDAGGLVTAVAPGKAEITAQVDGSSFVCIVRVN